MEILGEEGSGERGREREKRRKREGRERQKEVGERGRSEVSSPGFTFLRGQTLKVRGGLIFQISEPNSGK